MADLGLSRKSNLIFGENINEGDSRYMAPELLNDIDNHKLYDLTKADVFSLGLTIYELIINELLPKNGPKWG